MSKHLFKLPRKTKHGLIKLAFDEEEPKKSLPDMAPSLDLNSPHAHESLRQPTSGVFNAVSFHNTNIYNPISVFDW